LFQAITKCTLGNPANFPYATINPEESRVIVPDDRFDWLCEQYKPKSRVPAHLTVYDIAGLTRGASTGAGLGNSFLSHIRAVDAIFQVVRCFDDAEIIHVEGDVDPIRDLEIINEELRIKDIEFAEKSLENYKKQTRRGGQSLEMKNLLMEQATVEKVIEHLKSGKDVRKNHWTPKEVRLHLLSSTSYNTRMNQRFTSIIPALRTGTSFLTQRCPERMLKSENRNFPRFPCHNNVECKMLTPLRTGRDHQPYVPPHCQACRLPRELERARLHQAKEQVPPKDRRMDQGARSW
jgi:hypothetical protein